MGRDFAALSVLTIAAIVGLAVACGDGDSNGASTEKLPFVDSKGNHCSEAKFGLVASCEKTPAPSKACVDGDTACWVVAAFDPSVDAGSEVVGKPGDPIWNCAACCALPGAEWTGNTLDCAAVTCAADQDCASQDGICKDGHCTKR